MGEAGYLAGCRLSVDTSQSHLNKMWANFVWADAIFKVTPTKEKDAEHLVDSLGT